MNRCLVTAALLIAGCATTTKEIPKSDFAYSEFAGLVAKQAKVYKDVALDYELDDRSGRTIHFTSCIQVDNTNEDTIKLSEYELFKSLALNCKAIRLYLEKGFQAKRSHFPEKITKEIVMEFPATAGPKISSYSLEKRAGKTLQEYEPLLQISVEDKNTVEVVTKNHELRYSIMARADFNNDSYEDLLVGVQWAVRDAFGEGSELFVLEKKASTAPIFLTWRY